MKLIYSGPKPRRIVEYPIPLITKSEKEGEVTFVRGEATECPEKIARQLLDMAPEYFKTVESKPQPVMTKG